MLHQCDITKIDVFDGLEGLLLLIRPNTMQEGLSNALEYNGIIARQVLQESFTYLQYLFVKASAPHPPLRLAAEVENITQHVHGYLAKSYLH
jgi:hypothetical protein